MAPTALETALSQSQPAFNPTLDEETVRNYINIYKKGEEQLSKEDLALLEKHANFYKIPFALSEVDNDGSIKGMIGQLGSGFVSGFSTFNVGDPPKGTWEGIARNLGHLAGFVGFVPIPAKLARISKLARGLKSFQGKSAPMLAANWAERKVTKIASNALGKGVAARAGATSTAVGFLNTKLAKDIVTGGFHLGVASAVSSWQGGVDEMIKSFIHGAETGAVFRGIGNLIQTGDLMGDKILRGLASSAYTGLPSSMRGDTTPEQVYQYLLGAYFGVKEMPYHKRSGLKHLAKMHKKGKIYPEEVKGWEKLDETTQKWTKEEADRTFDKIGANALAFRLAQTGEIDVVEAQKLAEEYIANRAKYTSEGEEISPLSAKLVEGRENAAVVSAVEENRGKESTLDYSLDNTDIGAAIEQGMVFSKRTENWVKRNLEQVWNKPDVEPDTERARALLSFDIENQWLSFIKTARQEGAPNPSDEMIGWLRSTYGADIDQTGKNFWRQSGERMLKSRHVPMLTTFNGQLHELGKRDKEGVRNHLNAAGNRKALREEPKLIDEVHANATRRSGEEPSDHAYMILDHAVVTIPNRGNVELELIALADHFYREAQDQLMSEKGTEGYYTLVKGLALRKFQDYHANNFKAMDERGYFYYGGKGDAGRQYFVKYHPETAGVELRTVAEVKTIGGFENKGKGTPQGDGKDKAMRKVADSAIVELANDRPSSSKTTLDELGQADFNSEVVMLARNGSLKNKPLQKKTKEALKKAHELGVKFVVGDMPDVDSQFINYLQEIGADFTIYHTGKTSRIVVKAPPKKPRKTTSLDKQIADIRKVFEQHGITRYAFNKAFKEDMSEWNKALGVGRNLILTEGVASDMFKRAYISNVLYELELNGYSTDLNNLKTVLKDGFINSAKNFNKRQQIWFTSGFSSNPDFIRSFKGENNKTIDDLSNQGGWNVALIKDDAEILWGDGAIYGRSDAIDAQNADWGMPSEGGAHKSFIVSSLPDAYNVWGPRPPSLADAAPTNKGAILGKYMVHTASEPLQKFMKKAGIHFLIPESSAKQYGERNLGTLKWVNGKPTLIGTVENLPIESFKGVFSDKIDSHSIDIQRVPKQMMSNLTPFAYKRIGERIIDDMYNTLSQTEFNGDAEYNELLAQYLRSPSDNKDMLPGLIKNIDNIGIRPLLDAIKQPGAEAFANAAYASIQKINTSIINEMVAAGEMSYSESKNPNVEISQHSLVHDRMMRYSGESIASVLHKYSRDYRMATMRNYVVHRLTRPRVHNSFSARMRPFDLGLRHQKNTMQLKKKGGENIFFLDNGYRDMVIRSEELWGNKRKTLGEIWDKYNSSSKGFGDLRPQVKELLRTTIARVPMDSLSGAHVLEFKGFTGVRGYGVLIHPKTMEALGGADYDGDKAFGFFGDSKYGFKKSWKDMYANQKDEFGGETTDQVKAAFRSTFTTTPTGNSRADKLKQAIREQVLQYSPQRRRFFSESASEGREVLGPAVVSVATVNAAYASARASKNGYYEYEVELRKPWIPAGSGTRAIIRMIPRGNTKKEREAALAKFRRLARAAVAFSSDPMDEAGLKNRDVFYQNLVDSVFTWEVYTQRGKSKRYVLDRKVSKEFNSDPEGHQVRNKRMGLTGKFGDINTALYGRNLNEGKRLTFQEIREKLDNATNLIDGIPEESQNTFLAKLAAELKGIDWSDDIFKRIYDSGAAEKGGDPFHRLKNLYDEFHSGLGQHEWLREALGRGTLASPRGQYIDLVIKHKLWDETFLKEQLDPANENYKENILSGKQFSRITKTRAENNFKYNEKDPELREQDLRTVVRMAEDFIVNDLSDMASVVRLAEVAEGMDPAKIYDIFKFAERLKQESYLMAKDRSKISEEDALKTPEERQIAEGFAEEYFGEVGVSSLSDQIRINYMIRKKKYGDPEVPEDRRVSLNKQEQDLLDAFLLGSINRGRHKTVEKMEKAVDQMIKTGEYNGQVAQYWMSILDSYKKNIDNTSTSRLGLASDAVSENSVRKYMEHYERLFNKTISVPDKKTQERVLKEAEVADRPQPLFDRDGKRIKGSAIEASDYDETTQQYLDEYAPFVGLKNKPLSGEPAELYAEIRDHLEHYQNNVGRKLNGLVRGLFNKDLNEMNLEDFRNLNRFFKETRTGTWYQRLFQKVSKDKGPELSGWFYHMFPEAIHRNLLRYEMELMEVRRPYKDKFGNEITGRAEVPTSTIDKLENITHAAQEQSIQAHEEEKKIFRDKLTPYLEGIEDGNALYEMAVQIRQRYLKPRDENRSYEEAYRKSAKELDWKTLRGKKYRVILGKESKVMTGEEIVESINKIITEQNEVSKRWLKGDEGRIQEYLSLDNGTMAGLHKLRNKFIKDMETAAREGTKIDLGLGVDGMQKISKRVLMSLTNDMGRSENIRKNFTLDDTQFLPTNQYYPHIFGNRKIAMKERNKYIQKIMNDPTLTKEERGQQVRETVIHFHQMTGDWIPVDQMGEAYDAVEKAYSEIAAGKKKKDSTLTFFQANKRARSQFHRKAHFPGWKANVEAYESYMKNIIDTYYRLISQIGARSAIMEFRSGHLKKHGDVDLTNAWGNFYNLYARQAMGFPSKIPQHVIDNPSMKLKGTPYAWVSDSAVLGKLNRMRKWLGVKEDAKLPEELQGFDFQQMARWGNLEAKYELASLLAHPKSAIANLYGGTVHTLISTGYSNLKNARNFAYLKTNVNPEWKSMADVEDFVRSQGVIEEFMIYEANLSPELKGLKWDKFFRAANKKISKDPEMDDKSLISLAEEHGLTKSIFDKAAWFMRRPERTLRRDAFMAHYLQAREKFGVAIRQFDHPYLIQMAKRGVKATQFLYSAPHRPMFAATSLGKVWTRFQLWSWNAVAFRNQVIRDASRFGWREGTAEFERFQRLATADLFMLSLASVFMYSLFESALPAPWNWFQDIAELMFGDDKGRERAFFGAYPYPLQPLQMVTPPALRMLPPLFKGIVTDDYAKLSNYYIYTMFPFGRMFKDVFGPGGVLENPMYGVEKISGLPYVQFARQSKKEKEKKQRYPRGIL